jgi:thymidylate synthase
MQQYLALLQYVLDHGTRKRQRAVLKSSGVRPDCISIFGYQMRFNLSQGFPLVTTKRIPFTQVAHELAWYLRGDTNIAYLRQHNVKVWDEWADENGELGPIYGKQWRAWQGSDGQTVDQVAQLVAGIEAVKQDPWASVARRLILTAWNPVDVPKVKVPFCHTLAQFMVTADRLSCQLYQRSADLFLGVPWNIACYSLFTHLLAHVTGLGAGEFIHTFGDAHIYENHIEQVKEQLTRTPRPLPKLEIDPELRRLDDSKVEYVRLVGYQPYPPLRGEVAV